MSGKEPFRRVGLARALSKLGYCSRAEAFQLARAGRVRVNGVARRDPEWPVRLGADRIEVEGRAVERTPFVYLMMNKPRGVVTTTSDEKGRETVYAYVPGNLPRVSAVGRLDKASEGLLLLTNDSEWAAKVTAPETHLEKTYHVQIAAVAGDELAQAMMRGVATKLGTLRLKRAAILRGGVKNTWLEVALEEGKNRQIRRIVEALGKEVLRLVRVSIGPLQVGELPKGRVRELSAAEKMTLDQKMATRMAKEKNARGRSGQL